ncbi:hypothetical protein [Propionivibrio sp.]|uniref:transglutaminase domain-containing protein n=1 Tax=Propionivibrio sp. TaxID=2212460 RepID=UPI002603B218|nr:hypothetical protein [Propionivibrio sp.]
MEKIKLIKLISLFFCFLFFVFLFSNVNIDLTSDDEKYIRLISSEFLESNDSKNADGSYSDQIYLISKVTGYLNQNTIGTRLNAIPEGLEREPVNWYFNRTGTCYDLTRVSEKIFQYYGFKVRHVAIYSTRETGSALLAITRRRTPSHAILEVLTKKGWVLVDPYAGVVAVEKNGEPLSAKAIYLKRSDPDFLLGFHPIFLESHFLVYGLYSRHGMFYPPFNFLPDINWLAFIESGCCFNTN